MRIVLTVHAFPPSRLAGTEIYTESYAAALARAGHQVHVFAAEKDIRRQDLTVREESRGGFHLTWVTNNLFLSNFRETYERPPIADRFRQLLDRVKPDLVHAMHAMDLGVGVLRHARERGIPLGYTLHDYWFTCARWGQRHHPDGYVCETVRHETCAACLRTLPWRQPRGAAGALRGLRWLQENFGIDLAGPVKSAARAARAGKAAFSSGESRSSSAPLTARDVEERERHLRAEAVEDVDLFLAPSKFLRDQMVAWGIPRKKLLTSMIGIDKRPLRRVRRTPSRLLRVSFHGSLMRTKGAHVLLEAWARLPKDAAARGILTVRGAPRDAAYAREVARLSKRAGAVLEREFPRRDLAAKLSATDLLVVPSIWWENSPLAILEGLEARVPLLVSDLGGMAELVPEGRGGYRFPPGDPVALAALLEECLRSPGKLAACVERPVPVRSIDDDARQLPAKILEHHVA